MDTTITIAILGASISVVGWIVNYILSTSAERHRQKLLTQIEFTKQQLEELYGPLVFLVTEGQSAFSEVMKTTASTIKNERIANSLVVSKSKHRLRTEDKEAKININGNVTDSRIELGQDDEVWKYWIENEFFPRNEKIKALLANKTHLIEGEQMPASWLDFIEHYNSWKVNFDRWQKGLTKYPLYSRTGWPQNFDDDILSTFKLLKKRQAYLMGIISGRRN